MSILRFNQNHEWVRLDGSEAVVGITDYAQTQLGDRHERSPGPKDNATKGEDKPRGDTPAGAGQGRTGHWIVLLPAPAMAEGGTTCKSALR